MKITLTNENKNMQVVFYEHKEYQSIFKYFGLYGTCYAENAERDNVFKMSNPVGFFGNNTVNPYVTNGVNEDGVNFKANSFSPKTISWNFTNVLTNPSGAVISPNQYLNILLLEKNDVLLVEVETTKVFKQYFYVDEGTDTEQGIIQMTTASGGDGIYWNVGGVEQSFYFFSQGNEYVPKDLPEVLLEPSNYPFQVTIVSGGQVTPKYELRSSGQSGSWIEWRLENVATGDFFVYTNNDNDNTIIIDGNAGTVENEFGTDRTANITSGNIDLALDAGFNTLEWTMNGTTDYDVASEFLPLDLQLLIEYEAVVPSVE